MMKVSQITPDDVRWSSFLARAPHDFHHLPGFVSLSARTTERGTPCAWLVEEGEHGLLLPAVIRDVPRAPGCRDAVSPYGYPGPIFSSAQAREPAFVARAMAELSGALREQGVLSLFVRMHPLLDPDPEGFSLGCLVTHGETVVIDLAASEEEQWRQVQSGHRNEINKALRAGHEAFLDDSWTHFHDFVRLYTRTMERLEASPYYFFDVDYFHGFREALGARLHLGIVKIDGQVAAAALFTVTAGIVQYHLSGTDEAFARERPTKLLLHHVRKWASGRGERWFHLGGGLGASQDSLFKFKAGFSKQRRSFRTFRLVTDVNRYDALCRERDVAASAADLSGFFPAYRRT